MSFFEELFGPVLAFFVASKGAEAAISPPQPVPESASSDPYAGVSMTSEPVKWETRVGQDSPAAASSPEL